MNINSDFDIFFAYFLKIVYIKVLIIKLIDSNMLMRK